MSMFPDPESDPQAIKAADTFADMAYLVKHNALHGFGGAFAIIPPGESEPVTLLLLDKPASPAMFWSSIKTKIDMALAELADAEQRVSAYGRR